MVMPNKLKPPFEEKILSFFSDLFEYNRDVQIIVWNDEEYSGRVDKKSDDFRHNFGAGNIRCRVRVWANDYRVSESHKCSISLNIRQ
jgi:hypothetical protein